MSDVSESSGMMKQTESNEFVEIKNQVLRPLQN
jgi:hypothetical protein